MQQSAPARSGGDITTASHHPRAAGPSRQSRGATSAVGLTPRRRCPREGLARPAERWESRRRLGPGTTALLPRCPSSRGLLGRATNHGGTLAACSPLLGQAVASTGTAGQPPGEPREPQGKQGRGSPPGTQKPEAVVTKTPIPSVTKIPCTLPCAAMTITKCRDCRDRRSGPVTAVIANTDC